MGIMIIKVLGISQIKKKSLFKDKNGYKEDESISFLLWVWHHLNSTLIDLSFFGDFNHYSLFLLF